MSTQTQEAPKPIKHGDKIFIYNDGGGGPLYGFVPDRSYQLADGMPWIGWRGSKLPHHWWQKIGAFFRWTYERPGGKDEALVYLYYNETTRDWTVWAPPQKGIGMTVNRLTEHANNAQETEFRGFQRVGTVHHHCSAKAFASGTDQQDEMHSNGLHITIGEIDKSRWDLHARAVFNGNVRETDLEHWIGMADKYANLQLPPELESAAYEYSLHLPPPKEYQFPEQWRENFLLGFQSQTAMGFHSGTGSWHKGHTSQSQGVKIVTSFDVIDKYNKEEKFRAGWPTYMPHNSSGGAYKRGFWRTYAAQTGSSFVEYEDAVSDMAARLASIGHSVSTSHQQHQHSQRVTNTITASDLGEAKIRGMISSGQLKLVELQLMAEYMESKKNADPGFSFSQEFENSKNFIEVQGMLTRHGLNPRWMEKLAEELVTEDLQAWMGT